MRDGMIIASCFAIALGACSGGGTAPGAPAAGGSGAGEPSPGEPGNGGGAVGSDFGSARTAMESLRAEISAIGDLSRSASTDSQKSAVSARATAARAQYATAVAALERAAAALEAGTDAHAAAAAYLRGIRSLMAADLVRLDDAEVAVADRWAAGLAGPSRDFAAYPAPAATFERFKRAEADGSAIPDAGRLSVRTEPVPYSAGKTVFSPGGTGVTDELPLRSLTIRTAWGPGRSALPAGQGWDDPPRFGDWALQGRDGTPPLYGGSETYDADEAPTRLNATDGVLDYSIRITPGGLVYKTRGNAVYYDFQRRFDIGDNVNAWYGYGPDGTPGTADDGTVDVAHASIQALENAAEFLANGRNNGCFNGGVAGATADCTNWNHDDVKLTFGSPIEPLSGVNAFHWSTRIPFPEGTTRYDTNIATKIRDHDLHTPYYDLGSYELWISNFSGVDKGLETAGGISKPSDDLDRRFLQYAAYGLFTYTDMLVSTRSPSRQQAFHFGYDAFADKDGLRTTDIDADDAVEATFSGATLAYQYEVTRNTRAARHDIRGDITLNARIGSGANKISGEITNVEWRLADGSWAAYGAVVRQGRSSQDRLVLTGKGYRQYERSDGESGYRSDYGSFAADIGADGSYEGGVYLQYWDTANEIWKAKPDFDSYDEHVGDDGNFLAYDSDPETDNDLSIFGGTVYGPTDGNLENVETAGYWYLAGDPETDRWGGLVGSFGAIRTE